ncbi:MAG TPA: leucine-rich repeat protein [Bacteroidales bacterium]|nr:leucine-rich repeat protein [Bacteroidales bacterium]
MKKLTTYLASVLLSCLLANAQFSIDQISQFGNSADQIPSGMSIRNDALYISGNNAGESMLIRYGTQNIGAPVWNLQWPGTIPVSESFGGVSADDNGVYVSGYSYSQTTDVSGGKEFKAILCKFSLTGATGPGVGGVTWIEKPTFYPYEGYEGFQSNVLAVDMDTSFIYSCGTAQANSNNTTAVLTKHEMGGNLRWKTIIGNPASGSQAGTYAICKLNNFLYIGGFENNWTLWKVDMSGNKIWSKTTETSAFSTMYGLCATDQFLFGAGYSEIAGKGKEAVIIKYDQNGSIVWKKYWGGNLEDIAHDIAFVDNTLWVVGETNSFGAGGKDAFILKLNAADGSVMDSVFGGGTQDDAGLKILKDGSKIFIAGTFMGTAQFGPMTLNSNGGADMFLLKMNAFSEMNASPVTADANTVLLDHFDGSSTGQVKGSAPYIQSVNGLSQGIDLVGPGKYVAYSMTSNLESKGTVEMWVKPVHFSKGLLNMNWNNTTSSPSNGHVFHLRLDSIGKVFLSNWGQSVSNSFLSNSSIPLNAWTHIAVSWGDSTKIYINGKLDMVSALPLRPAFQSAMYLYLNYWGDSTAYYDELHISNIQRTEAAISSRIFSDTKEKVYSVSPGNLANILTAGEKSTLTMLKLSGSIDARDFKTMRDMPLLDTLDLSQVNIVAYSGTEGPRTVDTYYPENTIPRNAFYLATEKNKLTTVIQPVNLTGIGRSAYNLCSGLTNINWPSGLKTIGIAAFSNCRNLKTVNIPSGVTTIDSSTFRSCIKLTSINIPSSVTEIRSGAFYQCGELTSVNLAPGSQLRHIGVYAFGLCSKLSSFNLPPSVDFIGNVAFLGTGVTLNIPPNHNYFTSIDGVLYDKGLTRLMYCPALKTGRVDIPPTVTSIAVDAFYNCAGLDSITMSPSLQIIEDWAFENCTGLKTMVIPATVNQIWSEAFYNCSGLKSIYVNTLAPIDLTHSDSVFKFIDLNTCKLYVLTGLKAQYQAANKWKDFVNIVELNDAVNITPGTLNTLFSKIQRSTIKRLNLVGSIDARDFKTMRDSMPMLENLDLSGVNIVAYTGTGGTANAPENVYHANMIPKLAFLDCTKLRTITLPNSLRNIQYGAFINSGLYQITIPEGVKVLGDYAFQMLNQLEHVSLPASVDSIGYCTFTFNNAMKSFEVNAANPLFSTLDGVLFDKTQKTLVSYPNRKSNTYKVPDGVEVIDTAAFEGCYNLYSVTLPTSLKSICLEAFYECTNLVSIDIPASVTTLEAYAFYNCQNMSILTAKMPSPIDLTNSVGVFAYIDRTNCILRVPTGSKAAYLASARWNTFTNMAEDYTKQVTISNGGLSQSMGPNEGSLVTKLKISGTMDARDFKTIRDGMPLLAELDLSSVSIVDYTGWEGPLNEYHQYPANSIPPHAFTTLGYDIAKKWLTTVSLPTSVNSIGFNAFHNTGIRTLTLHEGITRVESWAFYNCKLTTIVIPATLTEIGDNAFGSNRALSAFTVAAGNPNYKTVDGALYDKSGQTLIFYPNSKSDGAQIPEGTLKVKQFAFEGCDFITHVTIPSTVTNIDQPAFYWAGNITWFDVAANNPNYTSMDGVLFDKTMTTLVAYPNKKGNYYDIPNIVNTIGPSAFGACWNLWGLNIPMSVTKISDAAFYCCSGLTSLYLPTSINSIGNEAFQFCENLKSINAYWNYPVDLSNSMNVFQGIDKVACVLKVPQGCSFNYRISNQWGDFQYIDENQNMTYRVKVPVGTKACFIAGEMNGWVQQPMDKESNGIYSITLNAHWSDQYKYCSGPEWKYEELDSARNIINNRNYSPMDTVRTWRNIYQPWVPFTPWKVQSRSDYSIGKIQFVSASEGWIASGNNNGLLHSINGGDTWEVVKPFPTDLAGNFSDPALSMDWVNPTHGWAFKTLCNDSSSVFDSPNGAVMYRTTDGGGTWSRATFPKTRNTIAYTDDDFIGDWQIHEIMEGDYQNTQNFFSGWSHMKLTVTPDGTCNFSDFTLSTGTWQPVPSNLYTSSNGAFSMSGTDLNGFLSVDKKTGFMTLTNDVGSRVFGVMQKQIPGVTYQTSDLAGMWQMNLLSVDNPYDISTGSSGWVYATALIDASGNAMLNMVNDNNELNTANITFTISSDGFVSTAGMDWHGFMNADKTAFYSTFTNDGGKSYSLCVLQKQKSALTYTLNDLQGSWKIHEIMVVNNTMFGSNGRLDASVISILPDGTGKMHNNKDGDNGNDNEIKLGISNSGIVTVTEGGVRGFMSSDKNSIIYSRTDKDGYAIGVFQKDSTFSGDMGLQVQFADESNGWASTYNNQTSGFQFFRSTNGGTDWNFISNQGPAGFFDFVDANNGWSVSNYPTDSTTVPAWYILHTTDGGLTWSKQFTLSSNMGDSFNAIQFTDLNNGWVTGNRGLLLKTTDGGAHWTAVSNTGRTYDSNSKALFFLNANLGWIAVDHNNGNDMSILKTTDGGANWSVQNTNLTDGSLFSLYFWDENHGWFTGETNDGYGYYSGLIGQLENGAISIGNKKSEQNLLLYPNPVKDGFYIRSIEIGSMVSIYNLNGVAVLRRRAEGNCYVDVKDLKKGMYVVRITTPTGVINKKIVKL